MLERDIFDIAELASAPVSAPVPVFGDESITCALLYNVLWEECLVDEDVMEVDIYKADDMLSPLYDYLTAMFLARWSRSADVDMEDGLEEKVRDVLENHEMSNVAPFNMEKRMFSSDHNKDAFVFGDTDLLSVWLGECLEHSAVSLSGIGSQRWDDVEEGLMWTSGNSPKHPTRPCFMETGWEVARDSIKSEFSIMRYSLSDHVLDMALIDLDEHVRQGCRYSDAHWEPVDVEEARKMSGRSDVGIAVVPKGESAGHYGYSLANVLVLLDVLDDRFSSILAIESGTDGFSKEKLSRLVGELGMEVLVDGAFCENSSFKPVYAGKIAGPNDNRSRNGFARRNEWNYFGEVPDHVAQQMDDVLSRAAVDDLVALVCRPTASERLAAENGDGEAMEWPYAWKEKIDRMLSSEVSRALTFGLVDVQPFPKTYDIDRDVFYIYHRKILDESGKSELVPTPRYFLMKAAKELIENEPEYAPCDDFTRAVTYIPDDSPLDDEVVNKFKERLDRVVQDAIESGIPSSLDAVAAGVPLEDVLA